MEEQLEKLRVHGYCQVLLNIKWGMFGGILKPKKNVWTEGIIVAIGKKRTRVDIGRKIIQKRNRFVQQVNASNAA